MEFTKDLRKNYTKTIEFLSNKKVQRIIVIALLLAIIIFGSWIRFQNMPYLTDQTNGEKIPLALDPFYFLRVAETMVDQGGLPEFDSMRYPSLNVPWTTEILPNVVVGMFKFLQVFDKDITLQFVHIISPVVFFAFSIILFFFLILLLTKNKWIGLLSSGLLVISPPYLYRTLAGFADHESLGMLVFFATLLVFTLGIKYLKKKDNKISIILLSVLLGFFGVLGIVSWGGIARFALMIIPFAFFLLWISKSKKSENIKKLKNYLLFFSSFIVSFIIWGLIFGLGFFSFIKSYLLGYTGILLPFVLIFMIIDSIILKYRFKLGEKAKKYRILISAGATLIFGAIAYSLIMGNVFKIISSIWESIFTPFGKGRVGLTIAENRQPYLNEWWSQIGKIIFWMFYLGIAFVGHSISKKIGKRKNKILFFAAWIIFISGLLFSRISSSSVLNGETFISQFIYVISFIIFAGTFLYIYFNDKFNFKEETVLIFSWLFFMLIGTRSAIRFFFAMVPFTVFMASFAIFKSFSVAKKTKDELSKLFFYALVVLMVIGLVFATINFTKTTVEQAKHTGPSAGGQWQYAMSWVRDNTNEGDIFVHWWDYGYWVQGLGERPTVTDGGHYNGYWDHLIGRYVLTTPYPETAKSFMKAHNVSYLLIDQTDIGKYSAYSSIGSDETGADRSSWIPIMTSNPNNIQETRNGSIRLYQGGSVLDSDIYYELEGKKIFLPSGKAGIGGVLIEKEGNSLKQPQGVFVHNGEQINLPIRYIYAEERFMDFGSGVNATIRLFPKLDSSSMGTQMDEVGALMYLSEKTKDSLFAQLYLMDDPQNLYSEFTLVRSQEDPYIASFRAQGAPLKDFVYYQGIRGPIKIWEIEHSDDIIARQEFLYTSGDYAELDDLQFIK
jgi:asparagine N-glycosylation enzyme membrane subunit Stt3